MIENWKRITGFEDYIDENKSISLGKFKEEIEAHEMYQKALKNIHLYMGDNAEFRKSLKEIQ